MKTLIKNKLKQLITYINSNDERKFGAFVITTTAILNVYFLIVVL